MCALVLDAGSAGSTNEHRVRSHEWWFMTSNLIPLAIKNLMWPALIDSQAGNVLYKGIIVAVMSRVSVRKERIEEKKETNINIKRIIYFVNFYDIRQRRLG